MEYMPETWNVISSMSGPTQAFPEAQIYMKGPQPWSSPLKGVHQLG